MRRPPKDRSPAPLAIGGRAQQSDQAENQIGVEDNILTDGLQTDRPEIILAWRDDLQRRVGRALLCFQVAGDFHPAEQESVAAEIETFFEICRWLAGSFSMRRTI